MGFESGVCFSVSSYSALFIPCNVFWKPLGKAARPQGRDAGGHLKKGGGPRQGSVVILDQMHEGDRSNVTKLLTGKQ